MAESGHLQHDTGQREAFKNNWLVPLLGTIDISEAAAFQAHLGLTPAFRLKTVSGSLGVVRPPAAALRTARVTT